jgi:hypothetical protein
MPLNERLAKILCQKISLASGMRNVLFLILIDLLLSQTLSAQPLLRHPISTEAEVGNEPCRDTIKVLKRTEFYDIGVVLPSWQPIVNENYVAVLEGSVVYNTKHGGDGPLISHEDYPLYHYTHDVNFNVAPDRTDDNRFTNLLPLMVYKNKGHEDTALRSVIHVEWECGIANYNKHNPFKHIMDKGNSAGFFSAGHKRGDVLWAWPSIGDWVHVEGHYVWDRGHPPAKAEIHPARFVATKRQLPEKIEVENSSPKFATRIDIFASGDGGALVNNRAESPYWVQRVKMSGKDYSFTVHHSLPKPSASAKLKYQLLERNGHSFTASEAVVVNDSAGSVTVFIPWKEQQVSDLAVFAKTVFLYWDEGNGVATDFKIQEYDVKLTQLEYKKLSEKGGKAELRMFANVGSHWVLLNDFFSSKGKVLSRGLGKTTKRNWQLSNSFKVFVPDAKKFRVYAAGWEADGVDRLMGQVVDQCQPCTPKTKRFFKKKMINIAMALGGCFDDRIGEATKLHAPTDLLNYNYFKSAPTEGENEDVCPFSKHDLKDRYFINYTIESIKDAE